MFCLQLNNVGDTSKTYNQVIGSVKINISTIEAFTNDISYIIKYNNFCERRPNKVAIHFPLYYQVLYFLVKTEILFHDQTQM